MSHPQQLGPFPTCSGCQCIWGHLAMAGLQFHNSSGSGQRLSLTCVFKSLGMNGLWAKALSVECVGWLLVSHGSGQFQISDLIEESRDGSG